MADPGQEAARQRLIEGLSDADGAGLDVWEEGKRQRLVQDLQQSPSPAPGGMPDYGALIDAAETEKQTSPNGGMPGSKKPATPTGGMPDYGALIDGEIASGREKPGNPSAARAPADDPFS